MIWDNKITILWGLKKFKVDLYSNENTLLSSDAQKESNNQIKPLTGLKYKYSYHFPYPEKILEIL